MTLELVDICRSNAKKTRLRVNEIIKEVRQTPNCIGICPFPRNTIKQTLDNQQLVSSRCYYTLEFEELRQSTVPPNLLNFFCKNEPWIYMDRFDLFLQVLLGMIGTIAIGHLMIEQHLSEMGGISHLSEDRLQETRCLLYVKYNQNLRYDTDSSETVLSSSECEELIEYSIAVLTIMCDALRKKSVKPVWLNPQHGSLKLICTWLKQLDNAQRNKIIQLMIGVDEKGFIQSLREVQRFKSDEVDRGDTNDTQIKYASIIVTHGYKWINNPSDGLVQRVGEGFKETNDLIASWRDIMEGSKNNIRYINALYATYRDGARIRDIRPADIQPVQEFHSKAKETPRDRNDNEDPEEDDFSYDQIYNNYDENIPDEETTNLTKHPKRKFNSVNEEMDVDTRKLIAKHFGSKAVGSSSKEPVKQSIQPVKDRSSEGDVELIREVRNLKNQQTNLEETLSTVMDGVSSNYPDLQNRLVKLTGEADSMKRSVQITNHKMEDLKGEMENLKGETDSLKRSLDSNNQRMDQRLNDIFDKLDKVQDAINQILDTDPEKNKKPKLQEIKANESIRLSSKEVRVTLQNNVTIMADCDIERFDFMIQLTSKLVTLAGVQIQNIRMTEDQENDLLATISWSNKSDGNICEDEIIGTWSIIPKSKARGIKDDDNANPEKANKSFANYPIREMGRSKYNTEENIYLTKADRLRGQATPQVQRYPERYPDSSFLSMEPIDGAISLVDRQKQRRNCLRDVDELKKTHAINVFKGNMETDPSLSFWILQFPIILRSSLYMQNQEDIDGETIKASVLKFLDTPLVISFGMDFRHRFQALEWCDTNSVKVNTDFFDGKGEWIFCHEEANLDSLPAGCAQRYLLDCFTNVAAGRSSLKQFHQKLGNNKVANRNDYLTQKPEWLRYLSYIYYNVHRELLLLLMSVLHPSSWKAIMQSWNAGDFPVSVHSKLKDQNNQWIKFPFDRNGQINVKEELYSSVAQAIFHMMLKSFNEADTLHVITGQDEEIPKEIAKGKSQVISVMPVITKEENPSQLNEGDISKLKELSLVLQETGSSPKDLLQILRSSKLPGEENASTRSFDHRRNEMAINPPTYLQQNRQGFRTPNNQNYGQNYGPPRNNYTGGNNRPIDNKVMPPNNKPLICRFQLSTNCPFKLTTGKCRYSHTDTMTAEELANAQEIIPVRALLEDISLEANLDYIDSMAHAYQLDPTEDESIGSTVSRIFKVLMDDNHVSTEEEALRLMVGKVSNKRLEAVQTEGVVGYN